MSIPNPFPSIFLVELPLSRWTFDFGSSGFPFLRDELFLFPHLINSIIILTTSSSLIWNISIYYISQIIYYIAIVFIFVFIFISHLWGSVYLINYLLSLKNLGNANWDSWNTDYFTTFLQLLKFGFGLPSYRFSSSKLYNYIQFICYD